MYGNSGGFLGDEAAAGKKRKSEGDDSDFDPDSDKEH